MLKIFSGVFRRAATSCIPVCQPMAAAFIFSLTIFLLGSGAVDARTIHVDAQAANGNGTASAPFRSITRAASHASPGDVVLVRAGVYHEQVKISTSGRSGAPLVVRADRGAVIDGRNTPAGSSLVEIFGNYVIFEGFQVQNARRTGISLWGTFNVTIRSNAVIASQGAGIWVGHDQRGKSGQNLIESNVVLDNGRMNRARNRSSGWPVAIAIAVSDATVVRSNQVYENFGEGIGVLSSNGVEVSRNTVYDNFSVNIYLDNAPLTMVQANLIGSTGNRDFFRSNRPADSVLIANEATRLPMKSVGIAVVSNTMIGVRDVYYGTFGLNTGLHNSVLAPNRIESARWLVPGSGAAGS